MQNRKGKAALALTIALAIALSAAPRQHAQAQEPPTATAQHPCSQDIQKFCAKAPVGRPTLKCLFENKDYTSPACTQAMQKAASNHQNLKEKCGKDATNLCPGRKLGQGELIPCIKENIDKVSRPCRQAWLDTKALTSRAPTANAQRQETAQKQGN